MSSDPYLEIRTRAVKRVAKATGVPSSTFEGKIVDEVLAVVSDPDNRTLVGRAFRMTPNEDVAGLVERADREAYERGRVDERRGK